MPLYVLPLCTRLLLRNTSLGSRNPNNGWLLALICPSLICLWPNSFQDCPMFWCFGRWIAFMTAVFVVLQQIKISFCSHTRFTFAVLPATSDLRSWELIERNYETDCMSLCITCNLLPLYSSFRLMSRMVWKSKGNGRCSRTGKTKNWKTWLILRHCWK